MLQLGGTAHQELCLRREPSRCMWSWIKTKPQNPSSPDTGTNLSPLSSLPWRMCIDNIKTKILRKRNLKISSWPALREDHLFSCINIMYVSWINVCSFTVPDVLWKTGWFTVSMEYIVFPSGWLSCICLFLIEILSLLLVDVFYFCLYFVSEQKWNGIWIQSPGGSMSFYFVSQSSLARTSDTVLTCSSNS